MARFDDLRRLTVRMNELRWEAIDVMGIHRPSIQYTYIKARLKGLSKEAAYELAYRHTERKKNTR